MKIERDTEQSKTRFYQGIIVGALAVVYVAFGGYMIHRNLAEDPKTNYIQSTKISKPVQMTEEESRLIKTMTRTLLP